MSKPKKASEFGMTGVAYTIDCFKEHNQFNNFRFWLLFIVNGQIVHAEPSQPFVQAEAVSKMDYRISAATTSLNARYKPGDFITMGAEYRDELINRLKKTNPELIEKIAPALNLPKAAS